MRKIWSDEAWANYEYWQSQDRKTLKKINRLLKSIDRNGYQCEGHPEELKGDLSGFYSVHIDDLFSRRGRTRSGHNFQISRLYSAIVRSEEKKPAFAMFTSIICFHFLRFS